MDPEPSRNRRAGSRERSAAVDVPVQFYQSVIAVEVAATGALLFQIRFFVPRGAAEQAGDPIPDPRLRLLMAVVIGATLFGSLEGIIRRGGRSTAIEVTVGLAISLLPVLLRALPPLGRQPDTDARDPDVGVTIIGLILYAVFTAVVVFLIVT
jgi:hypothetical protein